MADLLSVQTVATRMNVTDAAALVALDNLIDAAQTTIENLTWRKLSAATTRTEFYDAGRDHIRVDHAPITGIIGLWDDAQDSPREITSHDYICDGNDQGKLWNTGKVKLWQNESHFAGDQLDVRICYVGGWTKTTLPGDLREAWIQLVQVWHDFAERNSGESANLSLTTPDAVPKPILQVIMRYSLRGIIRR